MGIENRQRLIKTETIAKEFKNCFSKVFDSLSQKESIDEIEHFVSKIKTYPNILKTKKYFSVKVNYKIQF